APRGGAAARPGRPVGPPLPAVPVAVPGPAAVDRADGRRVRPDRAAVPPGGAGGHGLVGLPGGPGADVRLRAAAGPGTVRSTVEPAVATDPVPPADVPGGHPVGGD